MTRLLTSAIVALTLFVQNPRSLSDIAGDLHRLELELLGMQQQAQSVTVQVPDAPSFITAITAANPGDVLVLTAGQRYVVGNLTLPAKTGQVTITTSATLPARRITPADAALLPIIASGNNGPALDLTNAKNYKFDGVQFEGQANGAGEVVILENSDGVAFDRVLIVGGPNGQKRGIRGNGRNISLTRSHIANIWAYGQDTQAFCAWDGAGPYMIVDNYLEAASENVMFGGSDMISPEGIPSDILVENNDFTKRDEWRGQGKAVKNLFELKVGRRVVVRNNRFSKNWTDAQNGYGILFKAINQDGRNPWNVTEDVLFENNVVTETANGINVLGYDYLYPSGRVTRLTIRGNLVQTDGFALQLGGEVGDVTIDRNTFQNAGWCFMMLYGGGVWPTGEGLTRMRDARYAIEHLTFTGNLGNHWEYGVKADAGGVGLAALQMWAPSYTWISNVLLGGAGRVYPPTTYFDLASVPAGVQVGR